FLKSLWKPLAMSMYSLAFGVVKTSLLNSFSLLKNCAGVVFYSSVLNIE
ncbi:hypothetical protein HMPREF1452_00691, partial [Helicobacter pylori HP260Bi]